MTDNELEGIRALAAFAATVGVVALWAVIFLTGVAIWLV
jgi:hypothetical protein